MSTAAVALPSSQLRSPAEIHFGPGVIEMLPALAAGRGSNIFVSVSRSVRCQVAVESAIEGLAGSVCVYDDLEPELPRSCVDRALAVARSALPDVVIAIGGGSAIDLGKLVAAGCHHSGPVQDLYGRVAVPPVTTAIIAVPTTAGTGSEASPVAVVYDEERRVKVGIASLHLVPDVALCDPLLTLSCPPSVTAHSGIDALIHATEAYLARRSETARPTADEVFRGKGVFTDAYALEAIRRISGALERAVADGSDLAARVEMSLGSLYAGLAFGTAGTGAIHALQYPIGAATKTPHGLGVGLLAPYVLERMRATSAGDLAAVGRALGSPDVGDDAAAAFAVATVARLAATIGLPRSLREIGILRADLERYAHEASGIERLMRNTPQPMTETDLVAVLERAWEGSLAGG